MLLLLPCISLLDQQIRDVERRTARLLKELPGNVNTNDNASQYRDVDLLLSLPGVDRPLPPPSFPKPNASFAIEIVKHSDVMQERLPLRNRVQKVAQ